MKFIFCIVILCCFSTLFVNALDCAGKDKYSEECNLRPPADSHGHGHSHDHHGHSHEDHAHSHGDHAHSHGDHAHSHGDHAHSHGDHAHSHGDHAHSHASRSATDKEKADFESWNKPIPVKLTGWQLWFESLSCTMLISLAPFAILLFVRVDNSPSQRGILKTLLSFAAGGLLGDAFLHLIPHAMDPHVSSESGSHSHSHSHGHGHDHSQHMSVGLWVVAGILVFLLAEKLVRFINPQHSHSHSAPADNTGDKSKDAVKTKGKGKGDAKISKDSQPKQEIKIAGYLNLAADFLHNFTDGLAIGASFLEGKSLGMITTITVLVHEIPHEIGDYAILVQSGVPVWRARFLQLLTAVGAMLGTVVALSCQGVNPAFTAWILPFTAGGFIYIALVSVIPELLEETSIKQTMVELVFFLLGVLMMVIIGLYE